MMAEKLKPIVLLLVLFGFSVFGVSNAQQSDQAQQRVAALIPVLQLLLLDEDIERVEQPLLSLAETSTTLFSGATFTNVITGGAGSGALVFSTSNDAVAAVEAVTGQVTAVAPGMATITVFKRGDSFNLDGALIVFTVLVLARLDQSALVLADMDLILNINTTATNAVTGGNGDGAISYSSANPLIATVESSTGLITAVAAGSTTISVNKSGDATYEDAAPVLFSVTVNKLAQDSLTFNQSSLNIQIGDSSINLALGGNGTGVITYSSSAPLIVGVNAITGELTALAEGSATISAVRSGDDVYLESTPATYQVLVTEVSVDDCEWDQTNWGECNWQ